MNFNSEIQGRIVAVCCMAISCSCFERNTIDHSNNHAPIKAEGKILQNKVISPRSLRAIGVDLMNKQLDIESWNGKYNEAYRQKSIRELQSLRREFESRIEENVYNPSLIAYINDCDNLIFKLENRDK